jgi:hypothetical protein
MNWLTIGGMFARALLTTGGGYAVSKGWLTEDGVSQLSGALAILAGVGWSAIQKHNSGILTK